MNCNTQEAFDLLCKYNETFAAFVEVCDDIKHMDITERTRKSLIKKWDKEFGDMFPFDTSSYGANFQDADSAIEKIFRL